MRKEEYIAHVIEQKRIELSLIQDESEDSLGRISSSIYKASRVKKLDLCGNQINNLPNSLSKMTCPSTGHIHILRVPPDMTSAEAAITWVNYGIHPDDIAIQT